MEERIPDKGEFENPFRPLNQRVSRCCQKNWVTETTSPTQSDPADLLICFTAIATPGVQTFTGSAG